MPILLSRQPSTGSLASIVEKSQRYPLHTHLEYDLQLRNNQLDLVLLSKPSIIVPKSKGPLFTADEGFESDIDTISIISSENESFGVEKVAPKPVLNETDSANGGSGSDSETETEKSNTLTPNNVNTIKEGFEKQAAKTKETFDLVDCVCYTDVTYSDVLVFVIKNEALVFKFNNLDSLRTFFTNFTTLKAVTNQKAYNLTKNVATKYNLLQRTDQNGVTHIEIKKQNASKPGDYNQNNGPSSIISIDTPDCAVAEKVQEIDHPKSNKAKEANNLKRPDMKLLNDVKFNTVNNKLSQKKIIVRSSSIENILSSNTKESNLVKQEGGVGVLRKVWNSAEDLLDSDIPRRPERRRKKKPAPQPPQSNPSQSDDIYSGQFVRVNVNVETPHDASSLIIKSGLNEPHPKKLGQNFNLASFLRPKSVGQPLKYPQEPATLNRPQRTTMYEKNNAWTNSVPRILKKSSARSRSETRPSPQNYPPMAYRYVDTTMDYPYHSANQNNAMFLTATGLKPKPRTPDALQRRAHNPDSPHHQPRLAYAYNVAGFPKNQENNMGNRIFGLTPKLKDFTRAEGGRGSSRWGSASDLNFLGGDKEKNSLKSSIKSGEGGGKKKNDKKVTFSAYTTVQVV